MESIDIEITQHRATKLFMGLQVYLKKNWKTLKNILQKKSLTCVHTWSNEHMYELEHTKKKEDILQP